MNFHQDPKIRTNPEQKANKNKQSGTCRRSRMFSSEAACKICTILSLLYDVKRCSRFPCTSTRCTKPKIVWNLPGIAGCRCLLWPYNRQLYWSWFYLSSVCLSKCLLKAFHCLHVLGPGRSGCPETMWVTNKQSNSLSSPHRSLLLRN